MREVDVCLSTVLAAALKMGSVRAVKVKKVQQENMIVSFFFEPKTIDGRKYK